MTDHSIALERAAAVDESLVAVAQQPASLCPDRQRATPIVELIERALAGGVPERRCAEVARGVGEIVGAQVASFPENIFWDFDYLVARLSVVEGMPDIVDRIVDVTRRFGHGTAIRFRYVHDFSYGFDWAKWVNKDPDNRDNVGPYDVPFLAFMQQRADELVELIAADDAKYPRLKDEAHRNPFGFSREPGAEEKLHRALAREGLIPLEAWREDAQPVWNRPFADLREKQAVALREST